MSPTSVPPVPALDQSGRLLARISSRSALATDFAMLMERTQEFTAESLRTAVLQENVLARGSTTARRKLLKELTGRYLLDLRVPLFAAFLEEWRRYPDPTDRQLLAYAFFNLNDRTVFVTSRDWLFPYLRRAASELRVSELILFLQNLGKGAHPEVAAWTPTTLVRVAQHYLASVRDFGLATGGIRKRPVRPSLHAAPVRLLVRALTLAGISSSQAISHEAFKILGIDPSEVVDALGELNRRGALHFRMQADVIELAL